MFVVLIKIAVACVGSALALSCSWCRRESVIAHKQAVQVAPLRRSRRKLPRMTRLGAMKDSLEVEGEEESAETKTEDEYSPGDSLRLYL